MEATTLSTAASTVAGLDEDQGRLFTSWCAAVTLAWAVGGPKMAPHIARQARETFGMSVLFQRDPEPSVEVLGNGETICTYEGAQAADFMRLADKIQADERSKDLDLSMEDIALTCIVRAMASEHLESAKSAV
jgi:hypothetical protein